MSNLKKFFLIFSLIIIYILISANSYSNKVSNDLESKILRFHIIANSNKNIDQKIKFEVKKDIIEYLNNNNYEKINSKAEAYKYIEENKENIIKICNSIIKKYNMDYKSEIKVEKSFFPTKSINNMFLPCGNYDSIKINLGKAEGKNWWTSFYPSLFISNNSSKNLDNTEKILSKEETSLMLKNTPEYQIKFKIIEYFNN